MKTIKTINKSKLVNALLPIGIALFIICAFFTFLSSVPWVSDILRLVLLCLQTALGLAILILSLKKTHAATHYFIGMLLLGWGILHILVFYVLPVTLYETWPLYVIAAGVFLFVSGHYKYGKIKFGYAIPSFTLVGMGIWYALFSFNIIKRPFMEVVENLGLAFILIVAGLLVLVFLIQRKNKKFILPDDETGTFSDEDEESVKLKD